MATRSKIVEDVLMEDLVQKAMQNIDIEALVKKMAPKIEKDMEERLRDAFLDGVMSDAMYDAANSKEVQDHFRKKFIKAFTTL